MSASETKKRGLGRGLGSLLGDGLVESEPEAVTGTLDNQGLDFEDSDYHVIEPPRRPLATQIIQKSVLDIQIDKILPNSEQPRAQFDKTKLNELADSIREKGVLQPIVVRQKSDNVYEIIAGERRWRASQIAGKHSVPAIVRETNNQDSLELALIENIQRHDLNPIEEARAYQRLQDEYELTQDTIAKKVGKERATVANMLRLLQLHSDVQAMLVSGELTTGHAKALLAVTDPEIQKTLARKITSQKMTVRAAERLIKAPSSGPGERSQDPGVDQLSQKLQSKLGRRVRIDSRGGKGKVTISFYSHDELNEIAERILR